MSKNRYINTMEKRAHKLLENLEILSELGRQRSVSGNLKDR
jgi:hypothetical protein